MNENREIGNLEEILRLYAGEPAPPALPEPEDLPRWKEERRARLRELLCLKEWRVPPMAESLRTNVENGLIREELRLKLWPGVYTEATLLRPEGDPGPLPAVLALHDHGGYYYHGRKKLVEDAGADRQLRGFREQYYGGRCWASDLARRGYVVLAADAFYFGSRRLDLDSISHEMRRRLPHPPEHLTDREEESIKACNGNLQFYEGVVAKHLATLPVTWPGILAGDDMRTVDYLASRPEVDAGRIACCGLSIGGFRSALLCGLDERIRCAVVAGWMCTFSSLTYRNLKDHTFMLYAPHMRRWGDLPDIAGLLAPFPLLVQQCLRDDLFLPQGMEAAAARLGEYYGLAGAAEALAVERYDTHHQFNRVMQERAFAWLDDCLRLD